MVIPPAETTSPPGEARRPGRLRRAVRGCCRVVVGLLALGMAVQLVLVLTPATERLRDWLVVSSPPTKADVIVCLGGQYERLLWTSELFRKGLAPRAAVSNAPGAAEYMKQILVNSGLPKDRVLVDNTSYKTFDHPAGIARLPEIDKSKRLLIVTNKEHSRRVAGCFRRSGFQNFSVYTGPNYPQKTDFLSMVKWRILVLPNVLYEYSALVQYWWQGKI